MSLTEKTASEIVALLRAEEVTPFDLLELPKWMPQSMRCRHCASNELVSMLAR